MPETMQKHYLLELYGCPNEVIDDVDFVCQCLKEAADHAGTIVLKIASHSFDPQGVTAIALLAESHLSIHCWPETGYVAIDLFACNPSGNAHSACIYLAEALRAKSHDLKVIDRGRNR